MRPDPDTPSDAVDAHSKSIFWTLVDLMSYVEADEITWVENADGSLTPLLDPSE